MASLEDITRALVTLIVTIDPLANVPIFLILTAGMSAASQRIIVLWITIFISILLVGVSLIGEPLLSSLGISESAFKIAGGIFLFWTAFEMMYGNRQERKTKMAPHKPSNVELRRIAVSPLSIPLLAGPGTFTATIILTHEFPTAQGRIELIGIIIAACVIVGLIFLTAIPVAKYISDTTRILITRIFGLILGALAIQMILNGLKSSGL